MNDTDTHKISSVLPPADNPKDHFVCAKETGDIILQVAITPNNDECKNAIGWEATGATITSPAVGDDKLTAKLPSDTSKKIPVRIKVGEDILWEGIVWVVWVTIDSDDIAIATTYYADRTKVTGGYDFEHTITPASIITDADRPDLTGENTTNPPNVPAGDIGVNNKDVSLADGADKKWDGSRAAWQKLINPDSNNFIDPPGNHSAELYGTYPNYPSDSLCGNDDKSTEDPEDNDPYNAPNKGKLTGTDSPNRQPVNAEGSVGDTFEIRVHLREFARLELSGVWYKISDNFLWRIHFMFKKADEAADNHDYNSDGDKVDVLWTNNGSNKALDNNGF